MKFLMTRPFIFGICLIMSPVGAVETLPFGVSVHTLDNGLEVLIIEKPSLPMVGVNVVIKVGSAYETFASSGMSHMLEHLLFNGTSELAQKELYDAVDMIGGYNNANTGQYFTNFMMVTPAENIESGMKIQAGMLFDSVVPSENFEKEKGIVMEEIAKSLAGSGEQLDRNAMQLLFEGHSLALPTLGTYSTIRHMNRDDVYAFYKNHYVPNNMILSVVGNFKTSEILKTIQEIYGGFPPSTVKRENAGQWTSGFEKPTGLEGKKDKTYHRFYSGDSIHLQLFFSSSDELSREAQTLLGVFLEKQTLGIQMILKEQFPDEFESLSLTQVNSPVRSFIQAEALLKNESKINEIQKILKREVSVLSWALAPQTIQNEAVKAQAEFFRNTEKPHMFGINNASDLAILGIESILNSYSGSGYQKAADVLKDLPFSNYCFSMVQHPDQESAGGQSLQKPSVVLLPSFEGCASIIIKQIPGSDLVALHYLIKHKAFYENQFGENAAAIWNDCFGQRMESEEVQEEIKMFGLTFTVNDNPWIPMDNIYLHPDFGYIRVEGLSKYTTEIVQFLSHYMLDFTPSEDEFSKAVTSFKQIAMMKPAKKETDVFETAYKSMVYVEAPYDVKPALDYQRMLDFGKLYFQPSNMVITVVADRDVSEISAEFASFISKGLEQNGLPDPWDFELKLPGPTSPVIEKIGAEQALLFYGFVHETEPSDVAALKALSLLLMDEIIFDIREKQGLAYRMSAGIKVMRGKALFFIDMGTRPENVEKLTPQFPGFFSAQVLEKWTELELRKKVNMYLGKMMFRRLSSINQGYYLGRSLYFDGDVYHDERELQAMKQVSFDDVRRVAEKYLKVVDPVQVIVQ